MTDSGVLSVSKEDLQQLLHSEFISAVEIIGDFVQLFPPELSNKLFTYISDQDLFSCAKCSISWQRVINNNPQWRPRCIRRGWEFAANDDSETAYKWDLVKSHVSVNETFKFRTSPAFCLPPVASVRISPLCDWGRYYRQCLHLQRNWNTGIYTIHRLTEQDDEDYESMVTNDSDCNNKLLVIGTSTGKILLWNVEGVPRFIKSFSIRRRVEVESVKLVSKYLIVLYQIGLIKVFDTELLSKTSECNLLYQLRANGTQSANGFEFNLNVDYIVEEDTSSTSILEQASEDDVELWIRDLFRVDLWMGNEYFGSDMMLYANEQHVVLTGLLCKCFVVWDIHDGSTQKKILLKPAFQVVYQSYLSSRKLYLSTKKREENDGNENPACYLLVYDLNNLLEKEVTSGVFSPREILSEAIVEEVRPDCCDKRIVYATQDGSLRGILLKDKDFECLFTKHATSFVDNLAVSDSVIVYHQYDGFLVGINWSGETLYEIEAHIGLVKGLKMSGNILVSGGDAMQLSVWDTLSGKKRHTVHHQPCRIQDLYLDQTKIITVGREDPPVLIGYW